MKKIINNNIEPAQHFNDNYNDFSLRLMFHEQVYKKE